jgi:murein DD-endopeptidase MepM/ murein hydrolase activator NlpD
VPSIPSTGAGVKKSLLNWLFTKKASFSFSLILVLLLPAFINTRVANSDQERIYSPESRIYNSQTVSILSPNFAPDPNGPMGGPDDIQVEDGALIVDGNPAADKDVERVTESSSDDITIYTVREGDTLGEISEMFGIKVSTLRGFNNIRKDGDLKPGMELLILPIDGISYKIQKGDTIEKIAKKYSSKSNEIALIKSDIELFNDLGEDEALVVGTEIIIPNVESIPAPAKPTGSKSGASGSGGKGYFIKAWKGVLTQGFHDKYRAKDWGMPLNSKVGASASGKVIAAKTGWSGGYGNMIIIQHPNGAQTLYAHLNKILVSPGQTVAQGEAIGLSGSTGRSTGPHLHFEIRHWGDIPF